ncbi:MAG: hypothetical protein MHPSP_000827 [Paramarteilia canceri]
MNLNAANLLSIYDINSFVPCHETYAKQELNELELDACDEDVSIERVEFGLGTKKIKFFDFVYMVPDLKAILQNNDYPDFVQIKYSDLLQIIYADIRDGQNILIANNFSSSLALGMMLSNQTTKFDFVGISSGLLVKIKQMMATLGLKDDQIFSKFIENDIKANQIFDRVIFQNNLVNDRAALISGNPNLDLYIEEKVTNLKINEMLDQFV